MQERRNHPRLAKTLPLKVKTEAKDLRATSINISPSGIYCQIDNYIAPMTKVKIDILLPKKLKNAKLSTKRICCKGVVVRIEESKQKNNRFNIAVFFNELQEKDYEYISSYVNSHMRETALKDAGCAGKERKGCFKRYPRGAS